MWYVLCCTLSPVCCYDFIMILDYRKFHFLAKKCNIRKCAVWNLTVSGSIINTSTSQCESKCFKCAETHQYECFLSKPYKITFFVNFVHWVSERIWDSHRLSPVDLAVVPLFRPPKNCLTDSVCRKIMRCNIWRKSLFLNGRSRTHKFWPGFNHFVVQSSLKRAFLKTV